MTITTDDLLKSILESFDRINYIKAEDIPNIDLYMDQVTTFMDSRMHSTTRNPGEDKILTKTMINNYAKNDLLPPPIKKKYSKEHVLILIFIYYFKGLLSISDIQQMLDPIKERFFGAKDGITLEDIYNEVFELRDEQVELLKKDVEKRYTMAKESFVSAESEDQEFLQEFLFICLLSFDVYVKKLLIEKLIDEMKQKNENSSAKKAAKKPSKDSKEKAEK